MRTAISVSYTHLDVYKRQDMFNIVKGSRDVVEAVQMLIEKANSNGGRDNIGVIVAEPLADEVSVW